MLTGGPAQLDTWDPKPEAPSHIRSPFRPIHSNVPGIEISELFPRMARHSDKYALIRGCYHQPGIEPVHELSHHLICDTFPVGRTKQVTLGSLPGFHYPPVLYRSLTTFAHRCRRAVGVIESGEAQMVTIHMFDSIFDQSTWDTHGSAPFSSLHELRDSVAPSFDAAFTGLLEDLQRKNLLDTTLVVATGEFGRTPRINPAGGRDHWTDCWTTIMAGGGVQGGQVIGSSDAYAAEPKDRPVAVAEIAATIAYFLGAPTGSKLQRPPSYCGASFSLRGALAPLDARLLQRKGGSETELAQSFSSAVSLDDFHQFYRRANRAATGGSGEAPVFQPSIETDAKPILELFR